MEMFIENNIDSKNFINEETKKALKEILKKKGFEKFNIDVSSGMKNGDFVIYSNVVIETDDPLKAAKKVRYKNVVKELLEYGLREKFAGLPVISGNKYRKLSLREIQFLVKLGMSIGNGEEKDGV